MKLCTLLMLLAAASARTCALAEDCAGEIARYRAVQDSDYRSGNVAKSVYAQMQRETAAAEKVCSAGQDAKAMSLVRASQVRHGYPTGL